MQTISLQKIEDLETHINTDFDYTGFDTNFLEVSFENNTQFNENTADFIFKTVYIYKKRETLLSQSIKLIFSGDFVLSTSKTNAIANVILQFQSIAIGTIRGIIAIKTKSTKLEEYPLPLVDISSMQQEIRVAVLKMVEKKEENKKRD